MTSSGGVKAWFTAAELADMALPGLPRVKRKVNELAQDRRWALQLDARREPLARPRAGRGGGLEYHYKLLPPAAVSALVKRGLVGDAPDPAAGVANDGRSELWAWFDGQSDAVKDEARRRLQAIFELESLLDAGQTASAAVVQIGPRYGVSSATLWNWRAAIAGAPAVDRLPRIAPRRKGGGAEAEIHPEAWTVFKSDYLRPEKPTYAACYARLQQAAAARGWGQLPHVKTLRRKVEREVDARLIILRRQGQDALRQVLPPQQRSIADLHALQLVNIDGHKWDVFVKWPDGRIARPIMVAIQDVYSRKFLAWRTGETESAVQTRLAFADLFRTWGIPAECLLDNGRAFASKWITGGTANRYRFKVREEEPLGLLTQLGIKIHWAFPYRGQSKPIERAFRDLCEHIAKHPAFAGAYTGNRPDAKPENYASKAVDLETFLRISSAGIAAHNARTGRRTEAARGRSFDIAFAESYAAHPVGRVGPEQMRLALLAADQVTADRKTGQVALYGNSYWCAELAAVAGSKVTVRFDPDDLHGEVHVYDATGAFVASAPVLERVGFLDAGAAQRRARQESQLKRTVREKLQLEQLMAADDLAELLGEGPAPDAPALAPNVIRPVRLKRAAGAAALATTHPMDRFAAAEERLVRFAK